MTAAANEVILMEPGGRWPSQMDRVSRGHRRRPARGDGLRRRRKGAGCTEVPRALGHPFWVGAGQGAAQISSGCGGAGLGTVLPSS